MSSTIAAKLQKRSFWLRNGLSEVDEGKGGGIVAAESRQQLKALPLAAPDTFPSGLQLHQSGFGRPENRLNNQRVYPRWFVGQRYHLLMLTGYLRGGAQHPAPTYRIR